MLNGCAAAGLVMLGLVLAGPATAAHTPQTAAFKVCVFDQAAMLQRSKLAANMAARFQQVRQQAQAKFQADSNMLEADQRALNSFKTSLPPAVAKERASSIAARRLVLMARGEQINHDLAQLDNDLTANATKLTAPAVRAVETERGCSMLIARGTLLNLDDPTLDITPFIIDRLNTIP